MNKRYIYIIVIVAVLITICVLEQIFVTQYLSNMQYKIENMIEFVKDKDNINTTEIYDQVVEMEEVWNGYESVLCFIVNLKDIEDIGIELTKMKVYIVENDATEFKASLSLLLYYIDGYYNLMGISFENIF